MAALAAAPKLFGFDKRVVVIPNRIQLEDVKDGSK
jgi:hypothetical protein